MNFAFLSIEQVLDIHAEVIRLHGGSDLIHELGLVESALARPHTGFGGFEKYPTLIEKAAILGHGLTQNHGFKDGNKRVGFTAMDVFLRMNVHKMSISADDAEPVMLAVADGKIPPDQFLAWVRPLVVPLG